MSPEAFGLHIQADAQICVGSEPDAVGRLRCARVFLRIQIPMHISGILAWFRFSDLRSCRNFLTEVTIMKTECLPERQSLEERLSFNSTCQFDGDFIP